MRVIRAERWGEERLMSFLWLLLKGVSGVGEVVGWDAEGGKRVVVVEEEVKIEAGDGVSGV